MAQRSLISAGMKHVEMLRQQIRNIELLEDSMFRKFRWEVVSHYRRHETDQESLAIELVNKNVCSGSRQARERVDEILSMLDHVHDPFITGM